MANCNDNCASNAANVFREAVCINTKRVYDSAAESDWPGCKHSPRSVT